MRKGHFRTMNGKTVEVNIPETAAEIPLKYFLPARVMLERIDHWFKTKPYDPLMFLKQACEFLSFILRIPVNDLLGLRVGSPTDCIKMLKGSVNWDLMDATIFRLYTYIGEVLHEVEEPEETNDFWFEYKGEKWHIPDFFSKIDIISGNLTDIQAWQGVEIMTLQQQVSKIIDVEFPIDSLGIRTTLYELPEDNVSAYSDLLFEQYLKIIAVLARPTKRTMIFDLEQSAIDAMIEERAKHFADIDTKTAFDVFFYGLNMPAFYANQFRLLISSIHPQADRQKQRKV